VLFGWSGGIAVSSPFPPHEQLLVVVVGGAALVVVVAIIAVWRCSIVDKLYL
jgi:hypothetical protein